MKEGKASRSADGNAALRAVESVKPHDERVCYDPFAVDFLGGTFSLIAKNRCMIPSQLLMRVVVWYCERISPGGFGSIIAQTRHIDDYLMRCIHGGIKQLVILGAGYDSRAYRFDELKGKVKVFEVDNPATQRVKAEKVKKIFGFLPNHVIYVPIDFDKDKLDERLFESGYDRNLKTLFIWEGVTFYITAEAVDETLAFVAKNSGEGSSIIFNYIFQSVVDGTTKLEEAKKWRRQLERYGEPPTFGIEEGTTEEFLAERGFGQVKNMTAESLENTYFKGKNRGRKVMAFLPIVHATVKPRE